MRYNRAVKPNTWLHALERTRRSAFGSLATLFGATDLGPSFWEDLEATLIQADLGVETTLDVMSRVREKAAREGITRAALVRPLIQSELADRLVVGGAPSENDGLRVIVLVGVNGCGKTTTAARLAKRALDEGRHVLFAAADTYRAAAAEQLAIWADRLSIDVVRGQQGSDPGAVVYNAAQAALARKVDVLIVDTSGRMHTAHNLMQELAKICSVAAKAVPGAPHGTYLVLDATTGQNGLAQAGKFAEAVAIDGIILTKLDGSAKGGVAVPISRSLGLPILYVGIGEGIDDLLAFDAQAYAEALLEGDGEGLQIDQTEQEIDHDGEA